MFPSTYLKTAALTVASVGLIGAALPAQAQANYPNRPVTLVVGMPAGSATDTAARITAEVLSKALGQSVVVDNKPGAGGIIGTMHVVRAEPDGYTLLMSSSGPLAVNPTLYKKLSYDPVKNLAPITVTNTMALFLVANPSFPPNTVPELMRYVKNTKGLNYGSSGNGVTNHIAMAYFLSTGGMQMTHVPYKGGPAALSDVMAGHIPMMFETATSVIPQAKSGKLKVIASSGLQRSSAAPDIPTIAESGLPGFEASAWIALMAPAGTPRPIIDKLNKAVVEGLRSPEVKARFLALGSDTVGNSPEEFSVFLNSEIAKWGKVIRDTGAQVD